MSATVVLTRPQGKNDVLAATLAAQGLRVLQYPALVIDESRPEPGVLPQPDGYDLVVFVSSQAFASYRALLLAQARPITTWPSSTWAATVGMSSAAALRQSGMIPPDRILHPDRDSSQDSEALWARLEPRLHAIKRVLIVRGQTGRDWLGIRFEAEGIQVCRYSAYVRLPAVWQDTGALTAALRAKAPVLFVVTSSEGVDAIHDNIRRLCLEVEWEQARFVVIHQRVAQRLQSTMTVSDINQNPAVSVCAPCDKAIFQAVVAALSPYLSS